MTEEQVNTALRLYSGRGQIPGHCEDYDTAVTKLSIKIEEMIKTLDDLANGKASNPMKKLGIIYPVLYRPAGSWHGHAVL